MLAESRQKRQYVLVPRRKPLYEDENRFGTRMLEKMGWSKGKGLGANEDGARDFIRFRYKSDGGGLGFQDRDDQWTQHDHNFDGLLKSLNDEKVAISTGRTSDCEQEFYSKTSTIGFVFQKTKEEKTADISSGTFTEKISGISLEERSKKSKVRVHYKKFTKGKDISQYSEKDLANIFGKTPTPTVEKKDKKSRCSKNALPVNNFFESKTEVLEADSFNALRNQEVIEDYTNKQDICKNKRKKNSECFTKIEGKIKENDKKPVNDNNMEDGAEMFKQIGDKKHISRDGTDSSKSLGREKVIEPVNNSVDIQTDNDNLTEISMAKATAAEVKRVEKALEKKITAGTHGVEENVKRKSRKRKACIENDVLEDTSTSSTEGQYNKMNSKECNYKNANQLSKHNEENGEQCSSSKKTALQSEDKIYHKKVKPENCVSNQHSKDSQNLQAEQPSSLHNLRRKYEKFNLYNISLFCAEKFRNADLQKFPGSSLAQIEGYSLGAGTVLNVQDKKNDEERITNLWKCVLDKYNHLEKPKKTYRGYVKDVIKAKIHKQKTPKFYAELPLIRFCGVDGHPTRKKKCLNELRQNYNQLETITDAETISERVGCQSKSLTTLR
uniref:G-patch domain-containing protein n=1 Tax=Glossina brevipalpis TaxID=37001 RepID=A0A1A9WWF9_9MUSC